MLSSVKSFKSTRSPVRSHSVQTRYASNVKYTKDHEWIKVEGNVGTVGITSFATNALGDLVYVDLPAVGQKFKQKESVVSVESVKATGTVYAPASGEVTEVNTAVSKEPATINKSPMGEGWLVKMKLSDAQKELSSLLDEAAYKKHCDEESKH